MAKAASVALLLATGTYLHSLPSFVALRSEIHSRMLCLLQRHDLVLVLLHLLLVILLLELAEDLDKLEVHLVGGALRDVERQGQHIEGVALYGLVVLRHVEEQGELVGQVVVCLHLRIDTPLVGEVGLRGGVRVFGAAADAHVGWTGGAGLDLRGDSGRRLAGLTILLLRLGGLPDLEALEHGKMHHFLPLREYEVVLFEIFSQQLSGRLPVLHDDLAVLVVLGRGVQVPPPPALLEYLEEELGIVAPAYVALVVLEELPFEIELDLVAPVQRVE